MSCSTFFTKEQKEQIVTALKNAEKNTSGEIRVHIESNCNLDVLDRAAYIFKTLQMHKTELRNGVLFYLSLDDRKFAIIGDAGINAVVPHGFWDNTKDVILDLFKKAQFTEGLVKGLELAGEQLKAHFPYQKNDVNELEDEISFGN